MHHAFATVVIACAAVCAQAQDPLDSSDCQAARAELEHALHDPRASRHAPNPRLAQARRQAARACLGRSSEGAQRSGAPEPPQKVPPPVIAVRPLAAPPAPAPQPQPPLVIPRPTVITACDPAGCWDSEGRRLNNMGPLLAGPRGLCSLQGGAVQCP